jgi:exodeoxyribonuclease V alpha subunit
MNELAALFSEPSIADRFTETDRLVVEHLARRAGLAAGRGQPDSDLVLALLELARAVRLDHVALSLDFDDLASHLGDDGPLAPRRLIDALVDEAERDRGLVESIALSATVATEGAPVVLSLDDGRARFAHSRRLACIEHRLAATLVSAARDPAVDFTVDLRGEIADADDVALRSILDGVARRGVTVVTGGPGTGKTTALARAVVAVGAAAHRQGRELRVALCAPTAKAAVRLGSVVAGQLGDSASTSVRFHPRSGSVHRLLGLAPGRPEPTDDLAVDLVVADEVSMLEMPLLESLLRRVPSGARVVLSGDPDQLASVNVGAALRDIVEGAEALEPLVVRLGQNFRNDEAVQQLAVAVNLGSMAEVERVVAASGGDVDVGTSPASALSDAAHHVAELNDLARRDPSGALAALSRFVVLCATHDGPGSVAWWQGRLRPPGPVEPGATVLVTRNESARADGDPLHNGDVGVIVADTDGGLTALFSPSREPRSRPLGELGPFSAADALTIHKSQGSEYDEVVVSLPSAGSPILTRELLYTAVTRARRRVRVIADREALANCLARRIVRVSALAERADAISRESVTITHE